MNKKIDKLTEAIVERLGTLDVQGVRKVSTKKLLEGLDTLGLSPRSIRNAVAEVGVPNWSKSSRSFTRDKCKSSEISANEGPRFMSAHEASLSWRRSRTTSSPVPNEAPAETEDILPPVDLAQVSTPRPGEADF
jgi:hypothetical protein